MYTSPVYKCLVKGLDGAIVRSKEQSTTDAVTCIHVFHMKVNIHETSVGCSTSSYGFGGGNIHEDIFFK